MKNYLLFLFFVIFFSSCNTGKEKRSVQILNGEWEIEKTALNSEMPEYFSAKIQVPGLVDLAEPELDIQDTAYDDVLYWYKKNFRSQEADLVMLKINMAKYHTKVYLNGQYVGENVYNFTPADFNLKPFLKKKGEKNELVVSVGCRNNLSDTVINGHDFEKIKYIPGIYDEVKIISTGYPYIFNVQTVPDIENSSLRVVAELKKSSPDQKEQIYYLIKELESGLTVAEGKFSSENNSGAELANLDFTIDIPDAKLWSPEDPFLYEIYLETADDNYSARIGMREFAYNHDGIPYLLNGKPYYMRGTNVCIHRFFEDPEREELPWDDEWVIKLHERFKEMNWNSIRYCIGLPPERWYEIADSLGFLIQNEYPVWTLYRHEEIYPKITAEHLANEYREWLPAHWNHPCVVIWDAQNESITPVTGEAIQMVREMDLSNRPWENGWEAPVESTDPMEAHPYLFNQYRRGGEPPPEGPLPEFLSERRIPHNNPNTHRAKGEGKYNNPIIINEYAWLWLNRDGTTTTLTDRIYDVTFGNDLAKNERMEIYNHHLAMLTEYWRAYRTSAGVLHFCGLAYSRPEEPRGQTSDHFIDIANLTYEPGFLEYVKPAFSPVGLMIDFWEKKLNGGVDISFDIFIINDLNEDFHGKLKFYIENDSGIVTSKEQNITLQAVGRSILNYGLMIPEKNGNYRIVAEIEVKGEVVRSVRKFEVE